MTNQELADKLAQAWAAMYAPLSVHFNLHEWHRARLADQSLLDDPANRDAILAALRAVPEGWRPSDEQVERAAEAACTLFHPKMPWADVHESHKEHWRDIARAALTAASEPPP